MNIADLIPIDLSNDRDYATTSNSSLDVEVDSSSEQQPIYQQKMNVPTCRQSIPSSSALVSNSSNEARVLRSSNRAHYSEAIPESVLKMTSQPSPPPESILPLHHDNGVSSVVSLNYVKPSASECDRNDGVNNYQHVNLDVQNYSRVSPNPPLPSVGSFYALGANVSQKSSDTGELFNSYDSNVWRKRALEIEKGNAAQFLI